MPCCPYWCGRRVRPGSICTPSAMTRYGCCSPRATPCQPPTRRLVAYLLGRAEGTPLYVGELLRTLEDEGVLYRAADGWLLGDLGAVGVPPLLRQVLDT